VRAFGGPAAAQSGQAAQGSGARRVGQGERSPVSAKAVWLGVLVGHGRRGEPPTRQSFQRPAARWPRMHVAVLLAVRIVALPPGLRPRPPASSPFGGGGPETAVPHQPPSPLGGGGPETAVPHEICRKRDQPHVGALLRDRRRGRGRLCLVQRFRFGYAEVRGRLPRLGRTQHERSLGRGGAHTRGVGPAGCAPRERVAGRPCCVHQRHRAAALRLISICIYIVLQFGGPSVYRR